MAATNKQQDGGSDDFNFDIWSPVTKTTLIEKGLWDVVENGVPPDPSKIPELAAKIQPGELSKWRDLSVRDTKALQIMQSSLTDSVFRKTLSASSAKDVWDMLQKGNITDEHAKKIRRLEKQLEEVKRGEEEPMESYIVRVTEIVDALRGLNIEKSDYHICKKIFESLLKSYSSGIDSIVKELIEVHNVTASNLFFMFFSKKRFEFYLATEKDFYEILMDVRLQTESSSEKWCDDVCSKNSHNQENCKKTNQVNDEEEEEEEEEGEIVVNYLLSTDVTLGEKIYDEGIWMVYGHATIHMTPYDKYFTALDRTHKAKVGLADGTVLRVEGKGDVKIKMKEGKKKTINDVIFVPELNRNVLSLGQLEFRGCSLSEGRGGECIIRDKTGKEFGETMWMPEEIGLALRLNVIQAIS